MFKSKSTLCPYCKEKIKKNASKCKHCGEWIHDVSSKIEDTDKNDECIKAPSIIESNNVDIIKQKNLNSENDRIINTTPSEEVKPNLSRDNTIPKMFSKPFSFRGRIRRSEYYISFFSMPVYFTVIALISNYLNIDSMAFIFFLPFYWFILAQGAKRCHDAGYSGWFQLVPLFNFVILFFIDSVNGSNIHGRNPKGMNNSLEEAVDFYNRGFENRKARKYDEAVSDYKRSIELNPEDIDTYNNLAYCFLEMKKYEDAKIYFNKCLDLDTNYLDSYIGMSILHFEKENFDESTRWMQDAIKLKPIINEGITGIEKLEEEGLIYNEENKEVIRKIYGILKK